MITKTNAKMKTLRNQADGILRISFCIVCVSAGPFTHIGAVPHAYAGGIPVIDAASITQQITQIQHMVSQLNEMRRQLETAEKNLESISGSRGLANVINSAYDAAMDIDTGAIRSEKGLNNAEDYGLDDTVADIFNTQGANAAEWLGQSRASLQQAQERFTELAGLITKVNHSPDQKDILDLQARINAEGVMLQNESLKLSMMRSQAEARKAVMEQQKKQELLNTSGGLIKLSD